MRRTGLLLVTVVLAMVLASGVVLAATVNGDAKSNKHVGTGGADTMRGFGGADSIYGRGGRDVMYGGDGQDRLYGGNGFDRIYAGAGNDFVSVIGDDAGDHVNCGPGKDTVNEQPGEQGPADVYEHCEIIVV